MENNQHCTKSASNNLKEKKKKKKEKEKEEEEEERMRLRVCNQFTNLSKLTWSNPICQVGLVLKGWWVGLGWVGFES